MGKIAHRNAKPGERVTGKLHAARIGHPLHDLHRHQVDDKAQRPSPPGKACDRKAAHLDAPGKAGRGVGNQRTALRAQHEAIITDQGAGGVGLRASLRVHRAAFGNQQRQHEARLAGSRWSTHQNATALQESRAGVDRRRVALWDCVVQAGLDHAALSPPVGRRTVKRAPPDDAPSRPGLLAASMVPPCTSTICREIDRPRPELLP